MIAKMDATANDVPAQYSVRGWVCHVYLVAFSAFHCCLTLHMMTTRTEGT